MTFLMTVFAFFAAPHPHVEPAAAKPPPPGVCVAPDEATQAALARAAEAARTNCRAAAPRRS